MGPEEEMPELRTVTQRLSEEEIMEKIRKGGATPPKLNPGGPEPPYRCPPYDKALNERDMRVLMAYLKSMAPERKRFKFN